VSRERDQATSLWRGFRRPVRKDKVFWVAIGLCLVAVAAETALSAAVVDVNPIASVAVALLVAVVVFSVVGAIAGSIRGFHEGFRRDASERDASEAGAAPRPESPPADTAPGAGGRPLPTMGELSESARNLAANVRKPTTADVEKGARTLGRAIGAAKRAARSQPDD